MAEFFYQDILIENGDVVLDAGRNPVLIHDRAVIAQDIKHAIIESNVAIHLIAERSPAKKPTRVRNSNCWSKKTFVWCLVRFASKK